MQHSRIFFLKMNVATKATKGTRKSSHARPYSVLVSFNGFMQSDTNVTIMAATTSAVSAYLK
jgi:hypothetical protein